MWRNIVPCDQPAGHGNDLLLIPTATMESRHSVDGPTGRDFSSISIIRSYAGLKSKVVQIFPEKLLFWKKRPLTGKFSKIRSERVHRVTDPRIVCKFREIWPTGSW